MTYTLYGSEVSLYSGKVRAYLRFKDIPFREVLASANIYRTVILPKVGRPIIPVVQTPEGAVLQDTTVIIDALEQRFPTPSVYPSGPLQRLVALLLEIYADEWLVMPAMHYRWQFPRQNLLFVLSEFGKMMWPGSPRPIRPLVGLPPALVFGTQYQAYFGISRKMQAPIERSYMAFLRDFDAHLASHAFLLGDRPSIGDFGLIAPLYAHLYRDPAPGRLMKRIAPRVARWVERMQHPEGDAGGDFLADDEVPETLHPILRRMFTEQLPVLVDTIAQMHRWAQAHPERRRVSRIIGTHRYQIEGVEEERKVTPFSMWMFQRALDWYASLSELDRARVDPVLAELGGLEAMNTELKTRVAYVEHQMVVEGR